MTGRKRACDDRGTAKSGFRETRGMPEGCEYGLVAGTTGDDVKQVVQRAVVLCRMKLSQYQLSVYIAKS